ncbi:MAG TPA: hypothetical protein VM869_04115, partial [Enhygromyxa sp.]|nr:hypothetical protein [Enhygromyxa sp.]
PGERKRWQLGAALADEPSLLLCDEPGNHLDAHGRALLLAALREFVGVGVIVSHDRDLLDALCSAIVFVDPGGKLEQRPGNYTDALAQREAERAHQRGQWELARRTERRLANQVQAAREREASTMRSRRVSSRKRDHRDHDASSSARKYRAQTAEASATASLRRTLSAHDRARASVEQLEIDHRHVGELFVDWEPPRKTVLLSLTPDDLPDYAPHPGTRLPDDRPVVIRRDDRIHVAGLNGSGKSSLLRALVARASASLGSERILWMPQELEADARRELLVQLQQLDTRARGQIEVVGGLVEHQQPRPSCEAVERMVHDYPGALLISSHDRTFAQQLTRTRWQL